MDNNTLQFIIKAVDDASATLQKVKDATTQLSSATDTASASADKASAAGAQQSSSFLTLAASIFTGQEALNLFNEAVGATKEFITDSINASIQASATMAQVKVDVDNAGLSYQNLAPQLQDVAEKNVTLGFTQEDTQLSMGKLILATGSYSQALQLNGLAMDLSRAKGIDLNDATVLLQQVMAGNTRVLKQYGISLDGATTSAEALDMLQQKVGGSAEAFGQTAAGQAAEVSAQWEEVKKEFGDELMPVLEQVFSAFETELPTIIDDIKTTVDVITDIVDGIEEVWKTAQQLPLIGGIIKTLEIPFQAFSDILQTITAELREATGTTQTYANSQVTLSDSMKNVVTVWNQLHQNAQITDDDFKQMSADQQVAIVHAVDHTTAYKNLGKTVDDTSTSFAGITNHIQSADNAVVKHSEAISQLGDAYSKMQSSGEDDIDSLTSDFTSKMQSINDSIAKTQQSISDLTTSFNQQQGDETASVADQIVASEKKIADIKTQIAASTDATTTASLQSQLTAEQANYDSSLTFRQTHTAAMTAAEARGNETALQLTIDKYNQETAQETAAYTQKMTDLENELAAEQQQAIDETALYTAKMAKIASILSDAQATFIQQSNDRLAQTTTEVNAEIALYNQLAQAISSAKSGTTTSAVSRVTIPARASGGPVSGNSPYLVGEMGPELFVPSGSGSIVPSKSLGGGAPNINVSVTGTFMDENAAKKMGDMIVRNLQRVSRISMQ